MDASPELLAQLRRHFEPHNQELFDLLGQELWTGQSPGPPTMPPPIFEETADRRARPDRDHH